MAGLNAPPYANRGGASEAWNQQMKLWIEWTGSPVAARTSAA
jgi:hypothetical protein